MSKSWICLSLILTFMCVPFGHAASVDSDGGINLNITFTGDLDTDMVFDAASNPVNNPATGTQWQARDKFEHDLKLFSQHLYQMTEGKHHLKNVLATDNDRAVNQADIRWSNDAGLSTGSLGGWDDRNARITMRRSFRHNIHEVIAHEFGHYFYTLSDEYLTANASHAGYYTGYFDGTANFVVTITGSCTDTIMNSNNPYQFCDGTDHTLTVDYTHPTSGENVTGEVLTPALLDDGNADNDGPIISWINHPYAMDGWTVAGLSQTDLVGHHTDGVRPAFNVSDVPDFDIHYVASDDTAPGRILLLDRSGSMDHETFGIKASQYVQEAGLYLYHSSEADDYIGAFVYNDQTDELFAYGQYDDNNNLVSFYHPDSLTDIHKALKTALDTLESEHGADGVAGAEIFLMSDGKQTTGDDLWLQVDRAAELDVMIHTFSYGDADHSVMEQIASETSGDIFLMSERSGNLMNLKLRLVRSISKLRGLTPVYDYFGPLKPTGEDGSGAEHHKLSFNVPKNSKDLKFYMFTEQGQEGPFKFVMRHDGSGSQVHSVSSRISRKGRFEGQGKRHPRSAKWSVTIFGDDQYNKLPRGNVQLLAYVENSEIDTNVWMDEELITITSGGQRLKKVYASIANIYPLTHVDASAYFTRSSGEKVLDLKLNDSGNGGDARPLDGIYTGLVDTDKLMQLSDARRFNLKAQFNVTKDSIPAPNAEYEPKSDYKRMHHSYSPDIFVATAETGVVLSRKPGKPSVKLLTAAGEQVSRLDTGYLKFQLLNAHPSPHMLRVNLGQGISSELEAADRKKGIYAFKYGVSKNSIIGPRNLYIQFGRTKLIVEKVIVVVE